jgi:hypothetical protein
MSNADRTRPSSETRETEDEDARVTAQADDLPTKDEAAAADRADDLEPEAERAYKEALERGANAKGEGRLP